MILTATLFLLTMAHQPAPPADNRAEELVSVVEAQYDFVRFDKSKVQKYLPKSPIRFTAGTYMGARTFELEDGTSFYFSILRKLQMLDFRDDPPVSTAPNNVGVSWHSGQMHAFACGFGVSSPDNLACQPNVRLETRINQSKIGHTVIHYAFNGKQIVDIRIATDDIALIAEANKLKKALNNG